LAYLHFFSLFSSLSLFFIHFFFCFYFNEQLTRQIFAALNSTPSELFAAIQTHTHSHTHLVACGAFHTHLQQDEEASEQLHLLEVQLFNVLNDLPHFCIK